MCEFYFRGWLLKNKFLFIFLFCFFPFGTEPRIFATRQQYSTRLWKAHKRDDLDGRPAMTLLHKRTDLNSCVKSVDVSHVIDGEFCEVRSKHVTILRNG